MGRRDRITIPDDLGPLPLDVAREFAATDSDIRPAISPLAVPWLLVTYDELQRLPLDERVGFVVSRIDGRTNVDMLLDICSCAMPEDEVLDILRELARLGAIELKTPR